MEKNKCHKSGVSSAIVSLELWLFWRQPTMIRHKTQKEGRRWGSEKKRKKLQTFQRDYSLFLDTVDVRLRLTASVRVSNYPGKTITDKSFTRVEDKSGCGEYSAAETRSKEEIRLHDGGVEIHWRYPAVGGRGKKGNWKLFAVHWSRMFACALSISRGLEWLCCLHTVCALIFMSFVWHFWRVDLQMDDFIVADSMALLSSVSVWYWILYHLLWELLEEVKVSIEIWLKISFHYITSLCSLCFEEKKSPKSPSYRTRQFGEFFIKSFHRNHLKRRIQFELQITAGRGLRRWIRDFHWIYIIFQKLFHPLDVKRWKWKK